MALFEFSTSEVVTSINEVSNDTITYRSESSGQKPEVKVFADNGNQVDLANQFLVFPLNPESEGPTILEASKVEPKLAGSTDEPDVLAALKLSSFHVGAQEDIDKNTCATLRLNFGKDQSSSNDMIDTVFWSIAAGLRLYDQATNSPSPSKDLNGDFHSAFGKRPIEIPGGLGILSFDVIQHEEPSWWRKLLGFGQSQTAKSLVSLLGFPAITTQAIAMIDELLDRLDDSNPKSLFRSKPMRLALSEWSRDEYTGGSARIKIGTLNPGFCVLARGRDFQTLAESNSAYYPHYGRLLPVDMSESEMVGGEDPFANMTYAVIRVGMKSTKIDPAFNIF